MSETKQINYQRFEGWVITCPECGHKEYLDEGELAFDPMDGEIHIVQCDSCKQDFDIVAY